MKHSQVNHLRRLLGYVRCEVCFMTPDEIIETVKNNHKDGDVISEEGQQRLIEWHSKAAKVPKYVWDALKALEPLVRDSGVIADGENVSDRRLPEKVAR